MGRRFGPMPGPPLPLECPVLSMAERVRSVIAAGRSCRKIGRELDLSKNTVLDIVKRDRAEKAAAGG